LSGLERLALRAAADPAFLGHALALYAESEGLDDAGLADRLGCSPSQLSALRLCLRPRIEPEGQFRADLSEIAERFRLRLSPLAEAVRHADALAELRVARDRMLRAARDREPGGEPDGTSRGPST